VIDAPDGDDLVKRLVSR